MLYIYIFFFSYLLSTPPRQIRAKNLNIKKGNKKDLKAKVNESMKIYYKKAGQREN